MQIKKECADDKRIHGYARISTIDQNISAQIESLNKYGCRTVFKDEGVSGSAHPLKRPNFVNALNGLEGGGTFVVYKLDRLGRSLRGILDTIEIIQKRDIRFVSLTENIQTHNAMGKAFLQFIGILSELELNLIRERTRHGLAAARNRGQRLGRPFALNSQEILAAHAAFKNGHMSKVDIAKKYGVSDRTLRRGFERLSLEVT